ncbi:hypothetical protein [Vibrio sp. 10N.247.311.51]|uniref:hypothetical protein n=1 Tax=Vibrio sp. 10N.247.311.51 TaxID=3229996 RepID=UPI00354BCFBB
MKHMVKMSVSTLTSLVLLGCGGGSSSSGTTPTPTPSTVTVKAIDGYLVDAEVWIDVNDNLAVDAGDRYIGLTDTSGEIKVDEADTAHAIIVKAIAGQTYDQDTGGRLNRTYEMVSVESSNYISPFSTLARVNDTTTDVIATDLGYEADLISGDYVAATGHEAEKTHLLARSTVELLGGNIAATQAGASDITTKVNALPATIDTLVNSGEDLNTKVIKADGNAETKLPPLDAYLNDQVLYQFSTNETRYEREGYSSLEFQNEHMTYNNIMMAESFDTAVIVVNNSYIRSIDNRNDNFLYLSDEFGLTVSSTGTLDFVTSDTSIIDTNTGAVNFNHIIGQHDWYTGKSVYWLIDNAEDTDKASPTLVQFDFTDQWRGVMIQDNHSDQPFAWDVTPEGAVSITRDNGDKVLIFQPVIKNGDMIVSVMKHAESKYSRIPMFLVTEKDMALNLYSEWAK